MRAKENSLDQIDEDYAQFNERILIDDTVETREQNANITKELMLSENSMSICNKS